MISSYFQKITMWINYKLIVFKFDGKKKMAPWLVFAQIPEHEPHVSHCLPELGSEYKPVCPSNGQTDGQLV